MELRHLRYFLAVAELLNFTKAAARLRVAQPSLSRQIRDLEHHLGMDLFDRSSRHVRLTASGLRFVSEAHAVVQRAEQAVQAARSFATVERGEIHLGFAPSLTIELLPKILQAFEKQCPRVRVNLHDLSAKEMLDGLRRGTLDVALTVQPLKLHGLTFQPLDAYPLCIAVHRNHPFARSRSLTLAQIQNERLIAFSREEYPDYYEWLDRSFNKRLREALGKAEEHESGTSLIAAVASGRGVAVLPSIFASAAGSRLKLCKFSPNPQPLVLGIAYNQRTLSTTADRLISIALALQK